MGVCKEAALVYHVESRFREGIMCTREDLLEGANGVLERDELALVTSEDLSDGERLRHETLDFTSTLDLGKSATH